MTFFPLSTTLNPPPRFTNPFCYEPHPLCRLAAARLQAMLPPPAAEGKMMGVLVATDADGRLGFLAAYSGQIEGIDSPPRDAAGVAWSRCRHLFVPPIVDYLQPEGHFKQEEARISAINRQITALSSDPRRQEALQSLHALEAEAARAIGARADEMRRAKAARDRRRQSATPVTASEQQAMVRESQFLKAELRRTRQHYAALVEARRQQLHHLYEEPIARLRTERELRSTRLQAWLFAQFRLSNARGETRALPQVFADYWRARHPQLPPTLPAPPPPSGAGECCEPKLLQYAFAHHLRPRCMAMFWWGQPLMSELRLTAHFYPACSSRCKPILEWMLQGLPVEESPLEAGDDAIGAPRTLFDDPYLILVDKPAGMLAVPGTGSRTSVLDVLRRQHPEAPQLMMVHRLDMDTSGLLLAAKDAATCKALQRQFAQREVDKGYVAVVCPLPGRELCVGQQGTIRLPLSPDTTHRPRQRVDLAHGKEAVTDYAVVAQARDGAFRVALTPHTGRTHQLRVHCASLLALGSPIVGDRLYGSPADRLYLHASRIAFTHPATGERLSFHCPAPWEDGDPFSQSVSE